MKYAFIALHRLQFSVRTMCRLLRVHPSGFYTWLKNPLSRRANEDKRQTELLLKAWEESGKVYGYRKLHDDLLDQGEMCCPNRVARLTRLAGIKAQIGYKRRPGIYGGRPAVAIENTLDRQFDVSAPDKAWYWFPGVVYSNREEASCWKFANDVVPSVNTRLDFANWDAVREAAIAGLGVAMLPTFIVHDAVQRGALSIVHMRPPIAM